MKQTIIAGGLLLLFSLSVPAADPPGDDATTKPDEYYLKNGQAADSLKLLPPPPETGSILFLNDQAMYEKNRILRNAERRKQAHADADLTDDGLAAAYSDVFGYPITKKDTPELYKLLINMTGDTGGLATRSAKKHYLRIRPFAFYGSETCNPGDQKKLSVNGSYPSGHASTGWAIALVLAEVNPANQDAILERGYQIGQSRVICGYHWQSDVDAGRIAGSATVAALHANPAFQAQLAKAKQEFAQKSQK